MRDRDRVGGDEYPGEETEEHAEDDEIGECVDADPGEEHHGGRDDGGEEEAGGADFLGYEGGSDAAEC